MSFRTVFDFLAAGPCDESVGPGIDRIGSVSTGVELLAAVHAAIDKVRGYVQEARPLNSVGYHHRDAIFAQERNVLRAGEAFVADLDGMAGGEVLLDFGPGTSLQHVVVCSCEGCRFFVRCVREGGGTLETCSPA